MQLSESCEPSSYGPMTDVTSRLSSMMRIFCGGTGWSGGKENSVVIFDIRIVRHGDAVQGGDKHQLEKVARQHVINRRVKRTPGLLITTTGAQSNASLERYVLSTVAPRLLLASLC